MPSPTDPSPPSPSRHARVVFGAAILIGVSIVIGSEAARSAITLAAAAMGTSAVLHYAWLRRHRARRAVGHAEQKAPGRVVARRDPGRAVFELPAEGVEPWLVDGWVLALAGIGAVFMASAVHRGEAAIFALVLALHVAVGLRLRAAAADRLRIEVGLDDWAIESVEGGRPARRAGRGSLLPELLPDALLLWSAAGRVAVLRGELESEERAWLADELARLVRIPRSAVAEQHDAVHDGEAEHDRQGEQREDAK